MDTLEAILTRRSVRAFTPEPVPDGLLGQVLEAARGSASGGNLQAWGFVLVRAPERLAALRALAPGMIGRPAAAIAICLHHERAVRLGGSGDDRLAWLDIGIATENLLLAAHSLGLGACPIASFHHGAVARCLGLPQGVQPALLVALGHPRSRPASPGRRPRAEVTFLEEWGVPYE